MMREAGYEKDHWVDRWTARKQEWQQTQPKKLHKLPETDSPLCGVAKSHSDWKSGIGSSLNIPAHIIHFSGSTPGYLS